MGHVSVLGVPVLACCMLALCLGVLVPLYGALCAIAWRCVLPVSHMLSFVHTWLDVFWYLHGPWLMCSFCWSAILRAVLHCLDVFWPACCGCVLSVPFAIGGIAMHCLDVFVAYVLQFMFSAPLLEGLYSVLCLVLAGYMCILCFLYSCTFPRCITYYICVSASLPAVARVKMCAVFCAWCGLALCSILCFPYLSLDVLTGYRVECSVCCCQGTNHEQSRRHSLSITPH